MLKLESDTRTFISAYPNIVFTRADKGTLCSLLLWTGTHINRNKMTTLLGNLDTYVLIKKDPTRKLTTALRSVLIRWKTKGHIKDSDYKALYCSDGSLPLEPIGCRKFTSLIVLSELSYHRWAVRCIHWLLFCITDYLKPFRKRIVTSKTALN